MDFRTVFQIPTLKFISKPERRIQPWFGNSFNPSEIEIWDRCSQVFVVLQIFLMILQNVFIEFSE